MYPELDESILGWLADLQELPLSEIDKELSGAKKKSLLALASGLKMETRGANGKPLNKTALAAELYEYFRLTL